MAPRIMTPLVHPVYKCLGTLGTKKPKFPVSSIHVHTIQSSIKGKKLKILKKISKIVKTHMKQMLHIN